ncbi:MAG: hypothetical protein U0736_15285 [Gemmataceae bacterium]
MRRFWPVPLLAALGLTGSALTAQAQVSINLPFVQVRTGPATVVQTPFVRVVVPNRAPVVPVQAPAPLLPAPIVPGDPGAPPPVPLEDTLPPQPVPPVGGVVLPPRPMAPPVVGSVLPRVPTVAEFAAAFRSVPGGRVETVVLHPYTCQPVKVCFYLPGCPKKVRATRAQVDFRYGLCKVVSVRFFPDGSVRVRD